MAISRQSVRRLSGWQRKFLMRHIDGPVQVDVHDTQTRIALTRKKLLRNDRPVRPRATSLTTDGRQTVAIILAEAADALVAAGMLDAEIGARVVAAIAAAREPATEQILPPSPL